MRVQALISAVLLSAVVAQAAPPVVTVPQEVTGEVGSFVAVRATVTDAKVVKFVPVDPGLNVFPADLLADKTATVVTGSKPGKFRLICYSGNADGPSEPVTVTVVIGGGGPPVVDPVNPNPPTPTPAKAEKVILVVVEETLSRTVKQGEQLAALQEWADAGKHGRFTVDKDDPTAARNGYLAVLKEKDVSLPAVIVFDAKGGNKPLTVLKLDGDTLNKVKEVVK